jgi:holin-like protein
LRSALGRSRVLQICLIVLFSWLGQAVAQLLGLPVPGGVIGMAIVLALLATRRLRVRNVRRGASWLLGEMLLFFVPAVMSLLDHREFLGVLGLKLLAVILLGTALVMAGTALTIDLCYRWMNRRAA